MQVYEFVAGVCIQCTLEIRNDDKKSITLVQVHEDLTDLLFDSHIFFLKASSFTLVILLLLELLLLLVL